MAIFDPISAPKIEDGGTSSKMGCDFFEDGVLRSSGSEDPSSKKSHPIFEEVFPLRIFFEEDPPVNEEVPPSSTFSARRSNQSSIFGVEEWSEDRAEDRGGTSSKMGCDFFEDGSSEPEDRRTPPIFEEIAPHLLPHLPLARPEERRNPHVLLPRTPPPQPSLARSAGS